MAIPDYQTLMLPLLKISADGKEHDILDATNTLAEEFQLSDEERAQLSRTGQRVFTNRVGWARTYLKMAKLIEYPKRRFFQIADRGRKILSQDPIKIDLETLKQFPEFKDFWNPRREPAPEPKLLGTELADLLADAPEEEILDPTIRISRLASANRRPVSVSPDAPLLEATTLMLTNEFSQLPVMTSDREVKGLISWRSIGTRVVLRQNHDFVRDAMDLDQQEVDLDTPLLTAIRLVVEHDCVLVRDDGNRICGIVTTADLGEQFGHLSEPFLLLGEIENHLRGLIAPNFTVEQLAAAGDPADARRDIKDVSDLTFGEYIRLIADPQNWERIRLGIDRSTFVKDVEQIRQIRNDVMHFDPAPITDSQLSTLRRFAHFLRRIRQVISR